MNKKILFTNDWLFSKTIGLSEERPEKFEPVELPHDWLIEDTTDLYQNSVGWYKKTFVYDGNAKNISLQFDGVYMDSTIYVNNKKIGEWKYGYSRFEFELTKYLNIGENEILVKVVYQSPNSRWYTGAGIYRNVWLLTRDESYIPSNGIYFSTNKSNDSYSLEIETIVETKKKIKIIQLLLDENQLIQEKKEVISESDTIQIDFTNLDVKEWFPERPKLYQLKTILVDMNNNQMIEEQVNAVGFKTIEMSPDNGLRLNGQPYKIQGVCEHHDLGALGAAFNVEAMRRRMKRLKEMGVNAIRTAHNMPAKEVMELADELGFLISSESFDMWERPKTEYDYARFFNDWVEKDVKSWIERDRNHVSLFLWTIGNEVYDTHADEQGANIARRLMKLVKQYDPKENAQVTIGSNYLPWENTQKVADFIKVVGYNYGEKYYDEHHEKYPDWIIYGSETGSVVQSRGIYHFPFSESQLADDDEQCSALGNSSTSWGARSHEGMLIKDKETDYSMGQFIWTGFDYIGEPTPYHTKNAYFGQIDTAGFPKDSYYIYQAAWTDYKEKPMVHLFPYWDFNPGQTIDLRVATNAPKVKLFLNNTLIGEKDFSEKDSHELIATWSVPYEIGEVKAIAYDEKDVEIASSIRRSFKDSSALQLKVDKKQMIANGRDLNFVEISTVDKDGNPVENATNRVSVMVEGAGRLVGLDNGDSTDYDQYKGTSKRLFSGKLLVIIQATNDEGPITIKVNSAGLESAEFTFESLKSNEILSTKTISKNVERSVQTGQNEEIPVRKIELQSQNGFILDSENQSITVEAKIYPENASYKDISWSLVNDVGVEINFVELKEVNNQATITAKGDGQFRIRATSKNGTDKTKLISELDMEVTGIGTAYKDPYSLVAGLLYDDSAGEVTNGNERGVATSRDGKTIVGYHDVDFGSVGSDEITLPIFSLSDAEYIIEIWEGFPEEEGSIHLKTAHYQKISKWNVYQEETYLLSKKLKGITSIYFVMRDKVHLKGFYFTKKNRVEDYNLALDADKIYGDQFVRTMTQVNEIGNNVTLSFENMDFTNFSPTQIMIEGHSPIDKNTIHLRFEKTTGDQSNQVIEFLGNEKVEKKIFEISILKGQGTLHFVFLPGSHFNFKGFQFL